MKKKKEKYHDAIFIVVDEQSCPIYNVGEEIRVENSNLSISSSKPNCLYLSQQVARLVSSKDKNFACSKPGEQRTRYDCGGCDGIIYFEFKRDKDFSTLQMRLLFEAEEKRRNKHREKFFDFFRQLEIFEPLHDDALRDLTLRMGLKTIHQGEMVVKRGRPSTHLYIILQGQVELKTDNETKLGELEEGDIFGAMSLLSKMPLMNSIQASTILQLAMLSEKDFKQLLKQYPEIHLFIFEMLMNRTQFVTPESDKIASGMIGELSQISPVELFQLINSSHKTGRVDFTLHEGKGTVYFKEGEIIYSQYMDFRDKEAVYELLGMESGHFSYTNGIPAEFDNLPSIGGFMSMMMEGVHSLDESHEKILQNQN